MFALQNITKVTEGKYQVTSTACPDCNTTVTVELDSYKLFRYNQGALVQEVLDNQSPLVRERFLSGFCAPCFTNLFGEDL
jgi:hypothetical protein